MAVNRGKQFEEHIKRGLMKVDGLAYERLIDPTAGYKGVCNVCDFTAYKYPIQFYFECKSVNTNTMPWKNITENQWNGLIEKDKIKGVVAGYLIWFIPSDKTIFIPATSLANMRSTLRADRIHSLKLDEQFAQWDYFIVPSQKKRVFFDYDMSTLIDTLIEYEKGRIDNESV